MRINAVGHSRALVHSVVSHTGAEGPDASAIPLGHRDVSGVSYGGAVSSTHCGQKNLRQCVRPGHVEAVPPWWAR